MIRKIVILLVMSISFFSLDISCTEKKGRIAIITDKTGFTTELRNLIAYGDYAYKFNIFNSHITVLTKKFEVAITIGSLISIEVNGRFCTVRYHLNGEDKTLSGKLHICTFAGDTDFGRSELNSNDLKKIIFNKPPSKNVKFEIRDSLLRNQKACDSTFVLTDGTKVPVTKFWRYFSTYDTRKHSSYENTYSDFRFFRGKSLVNIEICKLKSIEFGTSKNVTVTLKNGKSTSGKLYDKDTEVEGVVEGWTGFYNKGLFFIKSSHIKKIIL